MRALLSGLLLAAAAMAQTPPPVDTLLSEAKAQAQASHRAVWVMFDASW